MKVKTCTKCKVEKPMSKFYRDKQAKDGLSSWCKNCGLQDSKKQYKKNRQKRLATNKEWYENNKKHVQKWSKEYSAKNKDHIRIAKRKRHIKNTFGITPEQYDDLKQQLLIEQDECCDICGQHVSQCSVSHNGELDLDHCHRTGKIRGLLCVVCNTRLAHIEDIEFVIKAKQYLAKHE